jgi:hypothetical protein
MSGINMGEISKLRELGKRSISAENQAKDKVQEVSNPESKNSVSSVKYVVSFLLWYVLLSLHLSLLYLHFLNFCLNFLRPGN